MSLGRPAYPRPKGTGDQSMPEKRGTSEVGESELRKTRMARPRLNYLKSNPDRPTQTRHQADSTGRRGLRGHGTEGHASPDRGIPTEDVGCRDEWTASTMLERPVPEKPEIA